MSLQAFDVHVVDPKTRQTSTITIRAASEQDASKLANDKGWMVSGVTRAAAPRMAVDWLDERTALQLRRVISSGVWRGMVIFCVIIGAVALAAMLVTALISKFGR